MAAYGATERGVGQANSFYVIDGKTQGEGVSLSGVGTVLRLETGSRSMVN